VFEGGTGKGGCVVAHRAILGCRNVAGVHAFCGTTPIGHMTGRTVIHDTGMVEHGRLEAAAGDVADPAILGCHNVADVHTFRCARAIGYMTGIAAHGQHGRIVMVDKRVGKTNRVMAQRTIGRGYRVRWIGCIVLFSGPERNKVAIVTGDTIAGDTLCAVGTWFASLISLALVLPGNGRN